VFYASLTEETAVAETTHTRVQFLAATDEPAQELDMRVYAVDLTADLHDIRCLREDHPTLYDSVHYAASQLFAAGLRDSGSDGIIYESVRHDGGECVAVFRPGLLSNCRQERHLCYVWDGTAIATIYEKKAFTCVFGASERLAYLDVGNADPQWGPCPLLR
jgi:hypothetical protein